MKKIIIFALVNRIMQAIVWLRRIRHCRGFGIQSPTDFGFVRDVVSERNPYYAYGEVGVGDSWLRRKLGQLYLRLANHVQPAVIVDLAGYDDYLHAGCRKARLTSRLTPLSTGPALVIARPGDVSRELLSCCTEKTVLVVEHIGTHRRQWQTVTGWPGVTVAFDLYYCGIATFNPARAKQQHIVNF